MDETAKADRLDAFLANRGLESVWFGRPGGFAWLTGGDNVVDRGADVGVAAAGYDGDGVTVVTDGIEAPRLRAEELPETVVVERYPWHERSLAEAVAAHAREPAAADFDVPGADRVDGRVPRQPLTPADVDRYRELGTATAGAVEVVCRGIASADTERSVAADLRRSLATRGIDAPVVLVGGAERARRYRHFTPQDVAVGDYAIVSVTATRGGLHASCTRTVAFDPPEWLTDRHRAATRVEATAIAATRARGRAGGTAGDVFAAVQEAYADLGHPGEWREHHQGGAAGYAGREWIATPGSGSVLELPMAYAWNPTVRGTKSEDTVLVDDGGHEVLTATGDWPTRPAAAVGYDATVRRPDVLSR